MFRDDHEAALARVEALENELRRQRADDAEHEARIRSLEDQLAAARTELARAKTAPPQAPAPASPAPASPAPASRAPSGSGFAVALAVCLMFVFIVIVVKVARTKHQAAEPPPAPPPQQPFIADQISSWLPDLLKRAHETLPNSHLVVLDAKGVKSDGSLHPQYGTLTATYLVEVTPVPPTVDPKVPIGAAPHVEENPFNKYKCTHVVRTLEETSIDDLGGLCPMAMMPDAPVGPIEPQCSMAAIWKRAIADGAPIDAIAAIRLDHYGWTFTIDDQRLQFDKLYPDDCTR